MTKKDLAKRAKDLHNLIKNPVAKDKVTIAVLATEENVYLVGTNEYKLREEQKKALADDEVEAKSQKGKHAEENVIIEAQNRHLIMTEIASSRDICSDCEQLIKSENISTKSSFSNKKSKNRK